MKKSLNLVIISLVTFLFFISNSFAKTTYKLISNTNEGTESPKENPVSQNSIDTEVKIQSDQATNSSTYPSQEVNTNSSLSLSKIDQSRFMGIAELQGLNKVTAKTSVIEAKIEEPVKFGNLLIIAHKCWQAPINQRPDSKILLEIFEVKHDTNGSEIKNRVFYGWLIASDPAVSALEHPIYDVTALNCKN